VARHDRYPIEYELPHIPHELPHLPRELPYAFYTDNGKSETNLEDAEASEQRSIRTLESETLKDSTCRLDDECGRGFAVVGSIGVPLFQSEGLIK
jgi:hypothetical protein